MRKKPEVHTCHACGRERRHTETIVRGEYALDICVTWQSCRAAQPPLDVMAGLVPA